MKLDPLPGDIAYFDAHVDGGDVYQVIVCYKYFPSIGRCGWYNTAGRMTPMTERHPGLRRLTLLLRNHNGLIVTHDLVRSFPLELERDGNGDHA